jgi:prepilin signal peptidase PulO-like enzyme (type II secretory pathway)
LDSILLIPLPIRLLLLFLAGVCAGSLINWAVYTLAWNRRAISPWSSAPKGAPPRRPSDRIPIVGWLGLQREARVHGERFWLRPLIVEVATGMAFAGLYAWETVLVRPLWAPPGAVTPSAEFLSADLPLTAHARYFSHVVLMSLMLAASLIDFDEKTIPDTITVFGTLTALVLAAWYPWSLLPAAFFVIGGQPSVEFLTLASPSWWPETLNGLPGTVGVSVGLFCWTLWCGGLLPRRWRGRRGFAIAARLFLHRLRVESITYAILVLWLAGVAAIACAGWRASDARWAALLTSLVGLAAGGGMIWGVRFVGALALEREAMGFGDVTLMSMIGAFTGWQACPIIFFAGAFFALAFAVGNWIMHREREIAYGPFLCLGASFVILAWPAVWDYAFVYFELGWIVPAVIACCPLLLGIMLWVYRRIADALLPPH